MIEIKFCKKRDGSVVEFDKKLIVNAINKSFEEAKEGNRFIAQKITESVVEKIVRKCNDSIPGVEEIQDLVEETLIEYNFRKSAKKYILYRDEHARNRKIV